MAAKKKTSQTQKAPASAPAPDGKPCTPPGPECSAAVARFAHHVNITFQKFNPEEERDARAMLADFLDVAAAIRDVN